MKKESQPSKDVQKQPEVFGRLQQPPTESLPKEQTNSAENEENNDRLLNTGVVENTDFSHLLEEMPLNELYTPLQEVPESIGRAPIIIGDGF